MTTSVSFVMSHDDANIVFDDAMSFKVETRSYTDTITVIKSNNCYKTKHTFNNKGEAWAFIKKEASKDITPSLYKWIKGGERVKVWDNPNYLENLAAWNKRMGW